jgi:ADP-heptose:LPS heptosyltransferase
MNVLTPITILKQWWRALRQRRKQWQLRVALKFLDKKKPDQTFNASAIKKVAVLRWDDKLGDTFVSTVFANAVKKHRPDIHLTYLVGNHTQQLLSECSAIDQLINVGKRSWKTANMLKKQDHGYDLVVDMGSNMSPLDFTALKNLKAKHYLGFNKSTYNLFDVNVLPPHNHFVERYLAAAKIITNQSSSAVYFIPSIDSKTKQTIEKFKCEQLHNQPFTLINLFASGKHRNFSQASAQKLIRWFLDNYLQHKSQGMLALLRVPGQDVFLEELVTELNSTQVVITPTPVSIPLSFALIEAAQLVISPDTALVQFCNALTPPLVAIYQHNDKNVAEWKPLNPNAKMVFTRPARTAYDRVNVADFSFSELALAIEQQMQIRPFVPVPNQMK